MRSLSLESIPANKNMKLLSLLITLLVLSYANSNRTSKTFSQIQHRLKTLEEHLEKHHFNAHNISVDIQTPHDIENACECKASFAKHLRDFLMSLKSVFPRNLLTNIFDILKLLKGQPDDCKFTHHSTRLTSDNLKKFIQDYIWFTKNWISHCKTTP